jgi:starvation-inducible outer membrane lipoprotein
MKRNIISFQMIPLFVVAFLTFAACSTTPDPPPAPESTSSVSVKEGVPGGVFVDTIEVSARVIDIDYKSREITILGPHDDSYTTKVGHEAVNFDKIKKNDLVTVRLTKEMVIYLEDGDAAMPDGYAGILARAPEGAQPGGIVAETAKVTATVANINEADRTATLKFEDGSMKVFPVRDDIDLSRHKAGERVVFLITEMIAIAVERQ